MYIIKWSVGACDANKPKDFITLAIADWIAIVMIGDWRLLSNQLEQSNQ